jgi:hypothetical protein
MRKIFKFNESYTNFTSEHGLIEFINDFHKLREGARRYIIWKEKLPKEGREDVFPEEIEYLQNSESIWVTYTDNDGVEDGYEIRDIKDFNDFLKNPQFHMEQDKYNL